MTFLVFFHGWAGDGRIWQRQAQAFQGRMEVLTPAMPGWDAGWVENYLGNLPLKECFLVGWSLGGMMLLEALACIDAAPAGLLLVAGAASFCKRPDYPLGQTPAAVRAMRRALKTDAPGVVRDFVRRCLAPEEKALEEEVQTLFGPEPRPEALAPGLDYLLDKDLRPVLPRLSLNRVALVQGEQDEIITVEQAKFLHQHLPGSRLWNLPGAGHLPFFTQAEEFNRILAGFLREGAGAHGPWPPPSNPPQ